MKDAEDIELCEQSLLTNFPLIQHTYQECLAKSKKYPEIDLKTILESVANIQVLMNEMTGENFSFDPA